MFIGAVEVYTWELDILFLKVHTTKYKKNLLKKM